MMAKFSLTYLSLSHNATVLALQRKILVPDFHLQENYNSHLISFPVLRAKPGSNSLKITSKVYLRSRAI